MLMHSIIDNFILSWSQNSVKLHLTSKELCSEQKNIFQVNPIVIFSLLEKLFDSGRHCVAIKLTKHNELGMCQTKTPESRRVDLNFIELVFKKKKIWVPAFD